jgi:NAD(P)-dependent dehydrogenase (short-subunit alcohol dehydrogenase family)
MSEFDGKVVVITGAGSGIGRATAMLFAREGAQVVVADLSDERGEESVQQIRAAGGRAEFIRVDVSVESDVERLMTDVRQSHGRLDFLVNNAGIDLPAASTVVDTPSEVWDRVMGINLRGVYLGCKYALPAMVEQGSGSIVNMASIGGIFASPANAAYSVSKAGVIMLTKQVALDYASHGIRVNCVCPGVMETPMLDCRPLWHGAPPERRQAVAARHPMGRLVQPDDVARAIRYLASDDAGYVTGHALAVDGGWLIGK